MSNISGSYSAGMKLSELSTDALSCVTRYLHYLDVANLWFLGCGMLNARLANGGVLELHVRLSTMRRPFRWPLLFSSLGSINKFAFEHDGLSSLPAIGPATLAIWSKSLQILDLTLGEAAATLYGLLKHNSNAFPTLHTLKVADVTTIPDLPSTGFPWPRSLTSLTCKFSYSSGPPLVVGMLPFSLTHVHGVFKTVVWTPECMFPATLRTIWLTLYEFANFLPLLPHDLETFSFDETPIKTNANSDEFWDKEGLALLPKSLKTLSIPTRGYTPSMLRQLPSTITDLRHQYSRRQDVDLALLPRGLKTTKKLPMAGIDKAMAPLFPPYIDTLGQFVEYDALPHLSCLAKARSLTLVESTSPRRNLNALLDTEPINEKMVPLLPPTLLQLDLFQTGPLTASQMAALPPTLTKLQWSSPYTFSSDVPPHFEDWKHLPRQLRTFTMDGSTHLTRESALALPPDLTSLNLDTTPTSVSDEWFGALPEKMTELQLDVGLVEPPFTWEHVSFPPHLHTLNLTASHPNEIQPGAQNATTYTSPLLRALPRCLSSLSLHSTSSDAYEAYAITEYDVSLLPPRLEELTISDTPDYRTPKLLLGLPRSLVAFRFYPHAMFVHQRRQ